MGPNLIGNGDGTLVGEGTTRMTTSATENGSASAKRIPIVIVLPQRTKWVCGIVKQRPHSKGRLPGTARCTDGASTVLWWHIVRRRHVQTMIPPLVGRSESMRALPYRSKVHGMDPHTRFHRNLAALRLLVRSSRCISRPMHLRSSCAGQCTFDVDAFVGSKGPRPLWLRC